MCGAGIIPELSMLPMCGASIIPELKMLAMCRSRLTADRQLNVDLHQHRFLGLPGLDELRLRFLKLAL